MHPVSHPAPYSETRLLNGGLRDGLGALRAGRKTGWAYCITCFNAYFVAYFNAYFITPACTTPAARATASSLARVWACIFTIGRR